MEIGGIILTVFLGVCIIIVTVAVIKVGRKLGDALEKYIKGR